METWLNECTVQKMKFSVKDFFSKCDQIQFPSSLVTFTEKILIAKFHFLCNETFNGERGLEVY